MKSLLAIALTLVLSTSFAAQQKVAVKPDVTVSVDAQKTIHVTATNSTEYDTFCHYTISRLVNTLSFKSDYGSTLLRSGETVNIDVTNNPSDYIALPHAHFSCN